LNGVVAALAAEARALGPIRRGEANTPGDFPQLEDGTLLAVSGIGGAAARAAARALVSARVSALMTFGLAGALDPKLAAGSIILPSELISPDGARFVTCKAWRERVAASLGNGGAVCTDTLLTSATAIETPQDKAAAFRDTGAAAVDMESAAVAEVAAAHSLPFIAVRVIVDTAGDALPRSVIAASRAGRIEIGRLITALLAAPRETAALIRLARRYRTAMRSLALVGSHLA
jgi:adenosylhomocysteine nucleosidase